MGQDVQEVSVPSSYDALETVAELLEQAARRIGVSEDEEADLMISVMEAVNNAIQHGNGADESKLVHIKIDTVENVLTIRIKDEGGGFQEGSVPDPRDPQNLMNVSGRGILMMKAFMDDVAIVSSEGGTEVTMSKNFTRVDGTKK
jgi:serine/threonine-protein kinase RsbW